MKLHTRLNRTALVGAALALVLSLALAPFATAATPVERHQAWADSLQSVLDTSPGLSGEEVTALNGALREVGPESFADDANPFDREVLERNADALVNTLSCQSFRDAMDGFGDLRSWLAESDVVAAALDCTCGDDDDCGNGYYCKAVECNSPPNTTHWGRCAKKRDADIEPVPVDPRDVLIE